MDLDPHDAGSILSAQPSAETAVYFLLGLLWDHVPHIFIFDEFEVDPKRRGYRHGKFLDARGRELREGRWVQVTFEFKLRSSSLLEDVQKYSGLHVDWLICWMHDAPAAEKSADNILCLEELYRRLPDAEQRRLILDPEFVVKDRPPTSSMAQLKARFSPEVAPTVEYLLERWSEHKPAGSEILLLDGGRTRVRVCSYSTEHLIILGELSEEAREHLIREYCAEELDEGLKVLLSRLETADLDDIVDRLRSRS